MSHHAASRSSKLRSVPVHVSVYSLTQRRMRASAVSALTVSLAPTISTDITSNVCSVARSAPTLLTSAPPPTGAGRVQVPPTQGKKHLPPPPRPSLPPPPTTPPFLPPRFPPPATP